MFFDGRIT